MEMDGEEEEVDRSLDLDIDIELDVGRWCASRVIVTKALAWRLIETR